MLCVSICLVLAGCVYIPTNFYYRDSRRNVHSDTLDAIIPGQTSKEDILFTLGEPDSVSDNGRTYFYRWEKVKGIFIVAGAGGAGGASLHHYSELVIRFDDRGIALKREINSHKKLE